METMTVAVLADLSVYELANIADVKSPKTKGSAGAVFLDLLRTVLVDQIHNGDALDDGAVIEMADGCVPVYTAQIWDVFHDLALYLEDEEEVGDETDMTTRANIIICRVGERLLADLVERLDLEERDEADEDNDDNCAADD